MKASSSTVPNSLGPELDAEKRPSLRVLLCFHCCTRSRLSFKDLFSLLFNLDGLAAVLDELLDELPLDELFFLPPFCLTFQALFFLSFKVPGLLFFTILMVMVRIGGQPALLLSQQPHEYNCSMTCA